MAAERNYWAPHVTVAAVIERAGRYLMVEERGPGGELVLNQPAGHLDPQESLVEAAVREVREETGYDFCPKALTGIYQWQHPVSGEHFLRVCFSGAVPAGGPSSRVDDPDILAQLWLSSERIEQLPAARLRSPMVRRCLQDHLKGVRLGLDVLRVIEGSGPF